LDFCAFLICKYKRFETTWQHTICQNFRKFAFFNPSSKINIFTRENSIFSHFKKQGTKESINLRKDIKKLNRGHVANKKIDLSDLQILSIFNFIYSKALFITLLIDSLLFGFVAVISIWQIKFRRARVFR